MRDLRQGMDAGVGAAGADDPRFVVEERAQRGLDLAGDRPLLGLGGEPVETAAVVRDAERDAQRRSCGL